MYGVEVTDLKKISVPGGDVLHAMKSSELKNGVFGEAYFSCVKFGNIKGWKLHTQMTMNLIVPIGAVLFVFYSEGERRFDSLEVGERNYVRLTVAPNIWFAFQGLAEKDSLILNIANIPHDPLESLKKEISEFAYDGWRLL